MRKLRSALQSRHVSREAGSHYGGLIFTSQRAVEALSKLVEDGSGPGWPHLQEVPVYSVGPATTRALRAAVPPPSQKTETEPPLRIFGEHTGNGEALAPFIRQHYGAWYAGLPAAARPPSSASWSRTAPRSPARRCASSPR